MEKKLAAKPQMATRYDVSKRTIDNWMRIGLPYIKIGKKFVRFDPDECDRWIGKFKVGVET
jgi:phage terminase Nu1 subunit (DNA packaging protein)